MHVNIPFEFGQYIMIGSCAIPTKTTSPGESLLLCQALEVFYRLHYGEVESAVAGGR